MSRRPKEHPDCADVAKEHGPQALRLAREAVNAQPETTAPEGTTPEDAPGDTVVDVDAKLAELATLSPIEYDRRRATEAEALGIRVATLDAEVQRRRPKDAAPEEGVGCRVSCEDPEPWPDRVDGAALADELAGTFERFIVLADGAAEALTLWVLHSHAHAAAFVSPILAISSPEKRCGKTTLLSLLGALVRRPLPVSNISAAALFRATELWRPTLLIDEADTFLKDSEDLRGILNSGHNRAGAFVVRTTGEEHEPRVFSTWAPKAVALIGKMHPTLTDRAVVVPMRRKLPEEQVERLRLDRLNELADLPRRLARWADDNHGVLAAADPLTPKGMNDRAADNWRALLALADRIGGPWPDRAREAVAKLTATDDGDEAAGVMLLEDLRRLFGEWGGVKVSSAKVVEALGKIEERPWPEWKDGRPLTARQLARLLKPFGIKPRAERDGGEVFKGYDPADFADAFGRYLPPVESPLSDRLHGYNAALEPKTGGSDRLQAPGRVTDRGNGKSALDASCNRVTDPKQGNLWEVTV